MGKKNKKNQILLGLQIKEARQKAGLTQKQVAEKMGYVHVLVHEWETGKKEPTASAILKLSKLLNFQFSLSTKIKESSNATTKI